MANEDRELFSGNVPGNLKMHYVVEQIKASGYVPEIISFCRLKSSFGVYLSRKKKSQECNLNYLGGISGEGRFLTKLDFLIKKLLFILWFIFKVNPQDTIVLYHSVDITNLIARLKRHFKRHVIIEVEEVYGYSALEDRDWVDKEIDSIKKMDAHICVNDGMLEELSLEPSKFVASYGVGNIPVRNVSRFADGKIHVVYAGTIEMKKRGALTAVESAEFLPDNYVLHILGFGKEDNLNILKNEIKRINDKFGTDRVQYNGYKSGPDLDDFLFSCHIGLSSNVMRPNFANNSFPSKVITYMCHDLSVVLGYAQAFYDVPISKGWSFYHEYTPEKIAEAVVNVDVKPIGYYHSYINKMNENLQMFLKNNCC